MSTLFSDSKYKERALKLCRGHYQRALINGRQLWSGADLRGVAKEYSCSYSRSRANLIKRLEGAGIPVEYKYGKNNRKILLVGFRDKYCRF